MPKAVVNKNKSRKMDHKLVSLQPHEIQTVRRRFFQEIGKGIDNHIIHPKGSEIKHYIQKYQTRSRRRLYAIMQESEGWVKI